MLLISVHPEGIISTYYKYFIKRKQLQPNLKLKRLIKMYFHI